MAQPGRDAIPTVAMFLCYASSEDDIGPVTALSSVTKSSRGWQSAKHCTYPQELGFRFEGLVQLDLVRLLAHECKIPSSVNVSVAVPTAEELQQGVCSPYEAAQFQRLGHVRFHTNTQKAFPSRELKSVGVGQQCTYLKLNFNRPHNDIANLFGQVGLVALTAHGERLRLMSYPTSGNVHPVFISENVEARLEEMAPLTEKESEVANYDAAYVAAKKIETLTREKARAVTDEDYDRAAKLKTQIDALEKAQVEVAKLEEEKRSAVKAEDYQRAKQLRQQIIALLDVDRTSGPSPLTPSTTHQRPAPEEQTARDSGSNAVPAPPAKQQRKSAPLSPQRVAALKNDNHEDLAVGGRGFYDFDNVKDPFGPSGNGNSGGGASASMEREIPQSGEGAPWERQLNAAIAALITDKSTPTPLTGDVAQEGKAFEKDLGVYCTGCLLAKRGQLREAAIRGVVSDAGFRAVSSHTSTAAESLMTYLSTKGRGIGDPVTSVVFASCEALVKLVSGSVSGDHVPSAAQLASYVAKLSPELVARIGDANARIRESVESAISAVARSPIGPDRIITLLMVDPDKEAKKPVNYRTHLARVTLLSNFVDAYGVRRSSTSPSALDTSQLVTQVVLPSMQNANSEVREAAAKLFARLIVRDGSTARPVLSDLKPAQQAMVEEQLQHLAVPSPTAEQQRRTSQHPPHRPQRPEPAQQRSKTREDAPARRESNPYTDSSRSDDGPSNMLPPLEFMDSGRSRDPEFRTLHTCQFCGEYDKNFTESNLDIHYVRACPMLCPCPLCDQVTEICTLQRHLVVECSGSDRLKECPRCHEAVRAEDFKRHVAMQSCIEWETAYSVCPLCHARFPAGMDGWRLHLATAPGCPNNPRKYDGSGPIML